MAVEFANPAHLAPSPSQQSLDMVGKVVTYQGDRHKSGPIECTVIAVEKVLSTITRGSDGSLWSAVRFRLKPTNGKRAFWTSSMPDEPLGAMSSKAQDLDQGSAT